MSRARELIENAVFIGGVPRSGTTFLARSLNSHPDFVLSADDHVLESWGLYYYKTRVGIVDGLRRGVLKSAEALVALENHLFDGDQLLRAVPSEKVSAFPFSSPVARPDGVPLEGDDDLKRHDVPLSSFSGRWRLCLKSPEITYVLKDLFSLLPSARFILVYRPLAEVAESMYRMGEKVKKVKIYHRRWRDEKDDRGRLVPPPGISPDWAEFWGEVTDFQRCIINGASYLKALSLQLNKTPKETVFCYNHRVLQDNPSPVIKELSDFLQCSEEGFLTACKGLNPSTFHLPSGLKEEFDHLLSRTNFFSPGNTSYPDGTL